MMVNILEFINNEHLLEPTANTFFTGWQNPFVLIISYKKMENADNDETVHSVQPDLSLQCQLRQHMLHLPY